MKKFIVTVNGNSYEVEVEEVTNDVTQSDNIQPSVQNQNAKLDQSVVPSDIASGINNTESSSKVPSGATTVKAPMPGTILDINVNVGDTVERGQVLCILEAMKMENEIMSPKDGKIATINTSKGASVDAGELLFSIE